MKHPSLCKEPYCTRKRRKTARDCNTCNKRKWRAKYPMKACYQTLRQNARRRGKPFTITFDYFKRFCYRTKYMAGKGRSLEHYSIHRIKNHLGYVPHNIRALTNDEHHKVHAKVLSYDYRTKYATVI